MSRPERKTKNAKKEYDGGAEGCSRAWRRLVRSEGFNVSSSRSYAFIVAK